MSLRVILLGPPGAGKGTQAKVLSQEFDVIHISTGDILRNAVKNRTEVGKTAKIFMDKGALVPDDVVIGVVMERIAEKDAERGFLLDGFPRTEEQAKELEKAFKAAGKNIDMVLYFKTSPETSIARLSGRRVCSVCGANFHIKNMPPRIDGICDHCDGKLIQREDDKAETVKKRLVIYEKETDVLVGYYKTKKLLREVPGDLDVLELFGLIKDLFRREGVS